MKKIASVLLVLTLLLCSVASAEIAKEDMKIGLICLHDENMGYDANFIDSMKAAMAELGLDESQLIIKTNVPETQEAYDAAADLAFNQEVAVLVDGETVNVGLGGHGPAEGYPGAGLLGGAVHTARAAHSREGAGLDIFQISIMICLADHCRAQIVGI